jgi:hypothetical protein
MQEINISEYDPSTLPADATVLLVGKRNTGKTTLTRDLMWHMRNKLDIAIGMCPTEVVNHNLEFFIPKPMIFHSFDDTKLAQVLDWQRRCIANNKGFKTALIMDDCMSETTKSPGSKANKKALASQDINKVFKLGRHLKLFFLNAMQYIKDAPPDIRGNVDVLFVFNTSSGTEREKLWKEYFAMFSKFNDFNKVFDSCAQGYDCIVLDMRKSMVNISDCVFFYRATIRNEPFQVGKKIFWDLSKYYYADTTDYDMDPSKVIGRQHLIDDRDEKRGEKEKKSASKSSLKSQSDSLIVKKSYHGGDSET